MFSETKHSHDYTLNKAIFFYRYFLGDKSQGSAWKPIYVISCPLLNKMSRYKDWHWLKECK